MTETIGDINIQKVQELLGNISMKDFYKLKTVLSETVHTALDEWSETITDNANSIYTILVSAPLLNTEYDDNNADLMDQMTFYNPLLEIDDIYNEDDYMFINVEDVSGISNNN